MTDRRDWWGRMLDMFRGPRELARVHDEVVIKEELERRLAYLRAEMRVLDARAELAVRRRR